MSYISRRQTSEINMETFFQDRTFTPTILGNQQLKFGEYENCTFEQLNLNSHDIGGYIFIDCLFEDCDLSMVKIKATSFQQVKFHGCKMLGLHFDDCNPFLFSPIYESCNLSMSTFNGLNLRKSSFKDCQLQSVDFTEADMQGIKMDTCDLQNAIFEFTNIKEADLTSSFSYKIDPEKNTIKNAKFSWPAAYGLLSKYNVIIDQ